MNILFVHSSNITDQYSVLWRCSNIAGAIERTGRHHAALLDIPAFVAFSDRSKRLCKAADLIVIHRYNVGPVLQAALYWKSQGKKLALDIDEAIDLIPEEMEHHRYWNKGEFPPNFFLPSDSNCKLEPLPLPQLSWAMAQMDAVTVSSKRLAGDWEKFGRVWEAVDYINFNRYLALKPDHGKKIWIGMGGDAVSAQTCLQSGLMAALEDVVRMRPQVRLFLGNARAEIISQMKIPHLQKAANSWLSPEEWNSNLLKLDIGLAPALTEYDLRSSRSRVLEYLAVRIPWIASDHLPYREFREYGVLVENTPAAWRANLLTIIDNIELYQKRAEAKPYLYAMSQDIDENVGKILEVYEQIIASR